MLIAKKLTSHANITKFKWLSSLLMYNTLLLLIWMQASPLFEPNCEGIWIQSSSRNYNSIILIRGPILCHVHGIIFLMTSCSPFYTNHFFCVSNRSSGVHSHFAVWFVRHDDFGGLVVSILATGTRVRGFKPGRSRWIFRASGKSSVCLPSEGK